MNYTHQSLYNQAIKLLQELIETPSNSKQEDRTADLLETFFKDQSIHCHRRKNNIWVYTANYDESKPTYLLNSHHDTVHPNPGYQRDPYQASIEQGRLYGLGSNDAGASLVSLISTFLYFYQVPLPFNLIFAASAEEEITGDNGIRLILPELPHLSGAIIGEPTNMKMAVAEKGLIVIDALAHGVAGHAAREEGDNAIYHAVTDINKIKNFRFDRISPLLGPVKMNVTIIEAGSLHNVIPAECKFTIDVRVNECYRLEEIVAILSKELKSELTPRSYKMRSSSLDQKHPLFMAGTQLGLASFGSPTTSDKAVISNYCPALKLGPGDSSRSHSADEFVYTEEINDGIKKYIDLINLLSKMKD